MTYFVQECFVYQGVAVTHKIKLKTELYEQHLKATFPYMQKKKAKRANYINIFKLCHSTRALSLAGVKQGGKD